MFGTVYEVQFDKKLKDHIFRYTPPLSTKPTK